MQPLSGAIFYDPTQGFQAYDPNQNAIGSNAETDLLNGKTGVLGASTTTGSSSSAANPDAVTYYNDQIGQLNNQIAQLDPQLQVGEGNINNAFDQQNKQLALNESQAQRDYNTNRTNTLTDRQTAVNSANTSVRDNLGALLRMLGIAGSGNSSASSVLAPYAAARQGNQQVGQINQTAERNLSALDTNWGDYEQNLGISRADLANQRANQLNSLQAGINQTRAQLLDTLAGLITAKGQAGGQSYTAASAAGQPYVSKANSLMGTIADLSRQAENPVLQAAPVAYTPPALSSYDFSQVGPATADTTTGFTDQVTPYQLLFGNPRDKNLNVVAQ